MATKPISRCQTADSEVPVFLKQRDVGTFETAVESLESKYRSTWRCSSVQRIKTKMLPLLITEDGRHRVFSACYPKNLLRHKSQEIRYPLWMLALIGKQLAGTFGTFASTAPHGPRKTTSRLLTGGPLKMASYVENASFFTGPTTANAITRARLAGN
jgi:hypothetical protein